MSMVLTRNHGRWAGRAEAARMDAPPDELFVPRVLVLIYHLLREGTEDEDRGPLYFDERNRQGLERRLVRRIEGLG